MKFKGDLTKKHAHFQYSDQRVLITGDFNDKSADLWHEFKQPSLTGLHLYWQAIAASLADRPVTVLDPGVTGRQHVLLVDPDEFSSPSFLQPMLGPQPEEDMPPAEAPRE